MSSTHSRLNLFIILLIFVLGLGCYAVSLNGPFLFDDGDNVFLNRYLEIHNLAPAALADAAFKGPQPFRPIANISFALNYLAHGYWLPGYHLTNVIIHCLTALWLYLLIKGTFATPALRQVFPEEKAVPVAGLSTLLWLLNPAATQSVSYIVQRMNSLAAMFFVLSVLLYLKGRTSQKYCRTCLAGSLVSAILAIGTKEIALTLPPVILLYEWYFMQDLNREWLKRKLPWLAVAAAIIILCGWLIPGRDFSSVLAGYQSRDFTVWQRLMTEPRVVCRFLTLAFFPYPRLLNLDHDFPLSTGLLQPPATIIAMVFLAGLLLVAIFVARRQRLLSFGLLWFFINLLVESTIIPLEIIFDHRTYLPLMFIWPPLLAGAWLLPEWKQKFVLAAAVLLLFFSAAWTVQRNLLWADEVALNRDIVSKSPNKARAHTNLGMAILKSSKGRDEEGMREIKRALELDPNCGISYFNLGVYCLQNRLYDEAVTNLKEAVRLRPGLIRAYYPLSAAYFEKKQFPEAIAAARIALGEPAVREKSLLVLGLASSESGDYSTAVGTFRELSSSYPNNASYRYHLEIALEKTGRNEIFSPK